ncbi:hypothetical protein D3C80_1612120 [compost metagenome]
MSVYEKPVRLEASVVYAPFPAARSTSYEVAPADCVHVSVALPLPAVPDTVSAPGRAAVVSMTATASTGSMPALKSNVRFVVPTDCAAR